MSIFKGGRNLTRWKVYFWLVVILGILTYWLEGFSRIWEIVDFPINLIAVFGIFEFVWNKKIFAPLFWKIFLILYFLWYGFYLYFIPLPPNLPELEWVNWPQPILSTLNFIPYIPQVIALYCLGFKKKFEV